MFGKTEWFTSPCCGLFMKPIGWQGWAYLMSWAGIVTAPGMIFLAMSRLPEAFIWSSASFVAFVFDLRSVRQRLRHENERDALFYIGDEESQNVATENYELEVRQENQNV